MSCYAASVLTSIAVSVPTGLLIGGFLWWRGYKKGYTDALDYALKRVEETFTPNSESDHHA